MSEHIKPVISWDTLMEQALKKNKIYYYLIRKNKACFTGNITKDVPLANKVIMNIKCNNTGHFVAAALTYGFNQFYGQKFNPKFMATRSHEISKFTTRLTKEDIQLVRTKFKEWIELETKQIIDGKEPYSIFPKKRLMHAFEALLCSGMRVGELVSINWESNPKNRIVKSKISGKEFAEIIINTEKTCKKREVYIPLESYNFFVSTQVDLKKKIYKTLITHGFIEFRRWAKLPFKLSAHVLRRTKATLMHEMGVDVGTIALVLGNTVGVVQKHYIISSGRNFDACDMANCAVDGSIIRTNNTYMNSNYLAKKVSDSRIDGFESLIKL